MWGELITGDTNIVEEGRDFVEEYVLGSANEWDEQGRIPLTIVDALAERGFLGATTPTDFGGRGLDQVSFGLLTEEIGRGCSSLRSLLTVHTSIVSETLVRWGTEEQQRRWLPPLAKGETIAAFCLSEPGVGSDAKSVTTHYRESDDGYVITGSKKWTTFGQIAGLFLVVATDGDDLSTFLVESEREGVEARPIPGLLGTRASMLSEVVFDECEIPDDHLLGRRGFGWEQIVNTALANGRYSVAWGSVGIARASLDASVEYADERRQFGVPIKEHQLVKRKIARMVARLKAARHLCLHAGALRDRRSANAVIQTNVAKYYASKVAVECAREAVQIHGAQGCHPNSAVQRYFRDAKVMEIIEGTSEIQELVIGTYAFKNLRALLDAQ